jgi:hypothetical protein
MALDATITHPAGVPLGEVAIVKRALAAAFPGVKFSHRPSGAEKMRMAAEVGVALPEEVREMLAEQPAMVCGEYQCADFSVQLLLPPEGVVAEVEVRLYGSKAAAEPLVQTLLTQQGWTINFS